ncbi:hypothetical protein QR98_0029000 [Sarcoptes scabiei]|uniref:Uncharacterized protein n=1 Tax=Sarcoptes scabiei TaxID=52283 RepID=A0A131ZZZ9_SARSC|nr:hypothetical protein QR98_0029000 [Sarcoptes scabiei]
MERFQDDFNLMQGTKTNTLGNSQLNRKLSQSLIRSSQNQNVVFVVVVPAVDKNSFESVNFCSKKSLMNHRILGSFKFLKSKVLTKIIKSCLFFPKKNN